MFGLNFENFEIILVSPGQFKNFQNCTGAIYPKSPYQTRGREGVDRISICSGHWDTGNDLFQGGCSFYIKNKLKSGIFNDKKVYRQKCFSLSWLRI